jgi:hypothetical protein
VIQQGEFFYEAGLVSLLIPVHLKVALVGEMFAVATEGRDTEAKLPGQGAVRNPCR